MSSGFFLVLEGIDGAGTTTQTARLAEALRAQGRTVHVTREPSVGPVGLFLRQALEKKLVDAAGEPLRLNGPTMALLFAADRVDHVQREIEPALARGEVVISDRYDLSSLIYQSATLDDGAASLAWIAALNSRVRRPDLTFVLHLQADRAAERRRARGGEPELFEVEELQRRLAEAYGRSNEFVPGDVLDIVDADAPIEAVSEVLLEKLRVRWDAKLPV